MREKMKNEKNKYESKNNLTPNVKYVRRIVSCRNMLSTISDEITLKVEEYKLKGRSIPRSLLVNDGFILSDEAIKRDEQRRKMIEEEAKADLRLREAIANRFSTRLEYPIEIKVKNDINKPALDYSSLNSNIRSSEPLDKRIVNDFFDGKLYQYLIRTINKNDAWKICKNRELSELYKKSPFDPMGFSYFNSVCYRIMINCNMASHDANLISMNRDESERYLSEYISNNTKNKIKRENYVHSIKSRKRIRNIVKLNEVFDEGILRKNLLIRTPALQLDFKYRVLDNFYYTCAVTGQKIPALLQACHIGDYSMTRSMSTSNGILLVSDCHNLFDNNLMGIEPERLTVHFNVKCIYADLFEGKKISKHKYQLDKKYLLLKWKLFNYNKNI
ncbi:hypothetical protein GLGR_3710 [Leminorella grimontii ATCC 33999 = DSM 5078]|nr:hypothetical protein GLGR_3710 [Leminorella grimontii ATCC 33999 = DSM 5078]